jgi:4-hydroxy-tetrahydrodipicolinate reductase
MNIALIGYGKMGKAIERIALDRGHQVMLRISSSNQHELTAENLRKADAVIEFTNPEAALHNVMACLEASVPVVCGSTGWNTELPQAEAACRRLGGAMLQASNFSVGVNLFFRLNELLAGIMNRYPEYEVQVDETHHTHKKDAPSGTAISIAEQIVAGLDRKDLWVSENARNSRELAVKAHRIDEVPGTHIVRYSSPIDDIEICHTAHNRDGFATGAVLAAEYIHGKAGIFSMKDVLGL